MDERSAKCRNIKSKRKKNEQCPNPATHGNYCGIHYKHPELFANTDSENSVNRIQAWWRFWRGLRAVRLRGIGYWDRTLNTNDSDFFSMDKVQDISGVYFFSYTDSDRHVYGFDIRSIASLLDRSRNKHEPQNPFTRGVLSDTIQTKIRTCIQWLQKRGISTEWEALQAPTAEQRWRMSIVDLFHSIDELNYYSSPDWFIGLNLYGHQRFYRELYDIWNYRAGLSNTQKEAIVPNHIQTLFRYPPWALFDLSIELIRKLNTKMIERLVMTATDRNDRILGAMYVISTLTLVNRQARLAYPWLYESVSLLPQDTNGDLPIVQEFGWIQNIITLLE